MIETVIQRANTSIAIDVHTAFLHADVDQDLIAEPPEPDEWYDAVLRDEEVWKLNRALYGYRKAPKLWHQHVASILGSLNYHPLLTDPSCFRNDELNINIFIHVDDGLLFGPRNDVLQLVELLVKQILMRIVGRMEKLGDKIFFPGRVIVRTACGYSVERIRSASEVHPRRDCCAWSGRLETSVDSEREEGCQRQSHWWSWRLRRRAVYRTAAGKLLYMCQERADIMYSVKETARKIMCTAGSDEMNVKRIASYLKGVPIEKCLIEINTKRARAQAVESRNGEARPFLLGQEHNNQ